MTEFRKGFILCETVAGALHTVSEAYGMDGCWLPWKLEKHVLTGGTTPFNITTSEYPRSLKDGVDKVNFVIEFDNDKPNLVKSIRFDELPSKGKYVVTQTSMKHLQDGGNCALWIEIPKGAEREGITAVQSLLKAEICCAGWKDHLPAEPETAIERAHLIIACDDIEWVKRQVVFKDSTVNRLLSSLSFCRIEIAALNAHNSKLDMQVAKIEILQNKIDELKAEVKTEAKAKDAVIDELEGKLKSVNTNFEKLQLTLKGKTDIITKLRRDLKAKGNEKEQSGSESSPTPATTKKRKLGATLRTPRPRRQINVTTPNTAPALHGSSSTLPGDTRQPTTGGTFVTRTPLTSAPRFNYAASTLGDTVVAGRTRGARMAALSFQDPPTVVTRSTSPSVITVSSSSAPDEEVFN